MSNDSRCESRSEDGRQCHGDEGHYPGTTHWAAASRVWTDTETLVRPTPTALVQKGMTIRVHGVTHGPVDITVADVEKLDDGTLVITPEASA